MLQLFDLGPDLSKFRIKIIGIGNGGINAINYMQDKLEGVQFIAADTDCRKLAAASTDCRISLGSKKTRGCGTGGSPQIGMEAAQESETEIRNIIGEETPLIFIVAGLGGGTGTGASPVVARIAEEMGALSIAAATLPSQGEGRLCLAVAEGGVAELRKHADSLLLFNNNRQAQLSHNNHILEMLNAPYTHLCRSVCGITDMVNTVGHVAIDLADMERILRKSGLALMGVGEAGGENRAREAVEQAITCPLQNDVSIDGAQRVLYNITISSSAGHAEYYEASNLIHEKVHPEAVIIPGITFSEDTPDLFRITVIATGLNENTASARHQSPLFKFEPQGAEARPQSLLPVDRMPRHGLRRSALTPQTNERRQHQGQAQLPVMAAGGSAMSHKPGSTVMTYDKSNPESPSFMRLLPD